MKLIILLGLVLQTAVPVTTPECRDLQKLTASPEFRTDFSQKLQAARLVAAVKCITYLERTTKVPMVRAENQPLALVYLEYIRQACENRLVDGGNEFDAVCKNLGIAPKPRH